MEIAFAALTPGTRVDYAGWGVFVVEHVVKADGAHTPGTFHIGMRGETTGEVVWRTIPQAARKYATLAP